MRKRKAFLVAGLVLLLLGMSAWGCGPAAPPTPTPTLTSTPTITPTPTPSPIPTPPPDQALREYVRKTGTIMLRFAEKGEEWQTTLAEVDPDKMTLEEVFLMAADTSDALIDLLDDLRLGWSLIDPPPDVQEFHFRMADCLDELFSAAQRTHDAAVREDLDATWNAYLDLFDTLDTCEPLAAEWDQIFEQAYPK